MAVFSSIERKPEDPILSIPIAFAKDTNPNKINLGVGAYRDNHGKPFVLPSVKEAEKKLLETEKNKEYLPIEGHAGFIEASMKLIFGAESPLFSQGNFFSAQTVGASGALRVLGDFIYSVLNNPTIHVSRPTWSNHHLMFKTIGFQIQEYPYYDDYHHRLDFIELCNAIKLLPPESIILLQACCHNPTGIIPSMQQWRELSTLIKNQKAYPVFDFAYQGFGKDLATDAEVIRYFVQEGHEMAVCTSHSKNFSLYGERTGLLTVIAESKEQADIIGTNIKSLIRSNYSSPPRHGAEIIATILNSPELSEQWRSELSQMQQRIANVRQDLVNLFKSNECYFDFTFLKEQQGMFSYSGLNSDQVQTLRKKFGIYMMKTGRINVAGLNQQNLKTFVDAVCDVL